MAAAAAITTFSPEMRTLRAQAAAYANIAKHGIKPLVAQMMRGQQQRFERIADEAFPGMRNRDPREFAIRVEAARQEYYAKLHLARRTKAAERRRAREEAEAMTVCPWCVPTGDGHMCQMHRQSEKKRTRRIHARMERQAAALAQLPADEQAAMLARIAMDDGAGVALHVERMAHEILNAQSAA